MSQLLHVFCSSSETLSRSEVIDFIKEGVFFDDPEFQPEEAGSRDCKAWSLDVNYDGSKRPIQMSIIPANDVTGQTIDEIITEHTNGELTSQQRALIDKLRRTQQHFEIEIGIISEDCWFMLDCLEAYIAKKLDGLVYADEGIYDKDLQPLWIFG